MPKENFSRVPLNTGKDTLGIFSCQKSLKGEGWEGVKKKEDF